MKAFVRRAVEKGRKLIDMLQWETERNGNGKTLRLPTTVDNTKCKKKINDEKYMNSHRSSTAIWLGEWIGIVNSS